MSAFVAVVNNVVAISIKILVTRLTIFCLVCLQYSLDNEAERQKYELQAQRIQEEMVSRLGTPNEGLEIRNERLNALKRLETQLNELRRPPMAMENMAMAVSSRQQPHPRSANLEQLYHEAIPMADKALSHSGPSAFGNALLRQQPVSVDDDLNL